MRHYYTYIHYRLDTNQPFYVGKGSGARVKQKSKRSEYWHNIVNKHGYRIEILESCLSESDAFKSEKQAIEMFRLMGYKLCNLTDGGEGVSGYSHPDWLIKRIADKQRGKKRNYSEKIKLSLSNSHVKQMMIESKLGNKNPMFGKKGELHHFFGKKHSFNSNIKNSNTWKKKYLNGYIHPAERKVVCINTGEVFNSIKQAANHFNISRTVIGNILSKKAKSTRLHPILKQKLTFKYFEEK